ncbi:MAG: glycosyltransferase family 4 protein [Planctomycetota bacterium]|nr:glycosyltransferase family 4 protein [Planctomycetota bacterium]
MSTPIRSVAFLMPYHVSESGGGAEVQASLLARELARRGVATSYVCHSRTGRTGQNTIDGVHVRWIPAPGRFAWRSGRDYAAALDSIRPDAVFVRTTSHLVGVAGSYAARTGAAFAWVCTDNWCADRWRLVRRLSSQQDGRGGGLGRRGLAWLNAFMRDVMRHRGMRRVTLAFTQSDQQAHGVAHNFGLESRRLPTGHDSPAVVVPGAGFDRRRVLWAGHLGRNKRPELFIDLALRLADTKLRFVMLGSRAGASSYVDELFRAAPDNLEWLGQVPFDESLAWFDRATLLVNTSREEGFPNTFIQSWLRGVPTLSLGVDPDGIVSRAETGFVAQDVPALARRIRELLSDRERYSAYSERALAYATRHHTVDRMTEAVLAAFGESSGRTFAVSAPVAP